MSFFESNFKSMIQNEKICVVHVFRLYVFFHPYIVGHFVKMQNIIEVNEVNIIIYDNI